MYTAQTWTPRPAEMLLYNILVKYLTQQMALVTYGSIVMILLVVGLYKLLQLLAKAFKLKIAVGILFNFSILFSMAFFFSSVSIGETWFWLCSSNWVEARDGA